MAEQHAESQNQELTLLNSDYEKKYGFKDDIKAVFQTIPGLTEDTVRTISEHKKEPAWMLDLRLKAYKIFLSKPMPSWGADLSTIDFNKITYYLSGSNKKSDSWNDVPEKIKKTFERLGIPEAEQKFLGGVGAQFESEVVYHKLREDLEKKGVVFMDTDTALKKHEALFRQWFGKVVPAGDNKFAALNTAVWSGGSFVYIPPGVQVDVPLQAYFRINAQNMGQFERTMIIVDKGASVHYIEGCFVKGTPIITNKGTKNIEEIKVNDAVLTHALQYRRVYKTQKKKYTGKLYSLKYCSDSRQEMQVTEEHPLYIVPKQKAEYKNTDWTPQWTPTKDVCVGDYVVLPIDRTVLSQDKRLFSIQLGRGRHGFKTIEVPLVIDKEFFRLAGYYLAEGSIISEHYLTFTFNKKEHEYIDDVKELCEKVFGKEPREQAPYNNGISLVLSSTIAARIFKQLFGSGAQHKSLPVWMLHELPEKQAELLKGWFRGDGNTCLKKYSSGRKRMFRICTTSTLLAEQMRQLLLRLNILSSINVWKRTSPRHDLYALYVGGEYFTGFAQLVGSKFTEEEHELATTSGNQVLATKLVSHGTIKGSYAFVPIRSIKHASATDKDVYNFSVEQDESYVSNGILVHNCTAPVYSTDSLHTAVVEVIALPGSKVRYTTIQNWSSDVYNLVTKRAFAYENAVVEWIDGNLGSKTTMKYPSVYLLGKGARADILSVAYAGRGQHQDAGGKAVHLAPNTQSRIVSKSVAKDGGRTSYRGFLKVAKNCPGAVSNVRCDALLLDPLSRSDTYPTMKIDEKDVTIGHEATVGRVGDEQLFYLRSRGLTESEALAMIVLGFIAEFTKQLPMEYAIELNKLIQLDMEGSVG